jgi:hypothetical protein
MAKTVQQGFRSVTPGQCAACGFDDDWRVDGRETIYCSCQTCPECGMFDGCEIGCPERERSPDSGWGDASDYIEGYD